MTPGRRELILGVLRESARPCSILELARRLRVHPNTVRFHLDALCRNGQVEQLLGDTAGPGRPPVLFRVTHRMDPAGPTNYRLLATMLTGHLAASGADPAGTATELGRSWGSRLLDPDTPRRSRVNRGEVLTRLAGVLRDVGFAPEPPTGPRAATIRLRHCPFLDLVTENGDGAGRVVCSLHLGLMQGVVTALTDSVVVDRLTPFVEPDLCVAHLAPARRTR